MTDLVPKVRSTWRRDDDWSVQVMVRGVEIYPKYNVVEYYYLDGNWTSESNFSTQLDFRFEFTEKVIEEEDATDEVISTQSPDMAKTK